MKKFAVFLLVGYLVGSYADEPERIVSGQRAVAGEFPYQVLLRYYRSFACGGALITDRHVLTAAHCVRTRRPPYDNFVVVTGTIDASGDGNGEMHKIKAIYAHPDFVFNLEASYIHDIAVITLEEPITVNEFQKPIKMATTPTPAGSLAHLTGWGRPRLNRPLSRFLMKLDAPVISENACNELMAETIYPSQVCTYPGEGAGACKGDSGGPLAYNNELIGIVSWTYPCAKAVADIFTRVSYYQDFIFEAMRQNDLAN